MAEKKEDKGYKKIGDTIYRLKRSDDYGEMVHDKIQQVTLEAKQELLYGKDGKPQLDLMREDKYQLKVADTIADKLKEYALSKWGSSGDDFMDEQLLQVYGNITRQQIRQLAKTHQENFFDIWDRITKQQLRDTVKSNAEDYALSQLMPEDAKDVLSHLEAEVDPRVKDWIEEEGFNDIHAKDLLKTYVSNKALSAEALKGKSYAKKEKKKAA